MTVEKLIVAAFLTKELLQFEEFLFYFLEDFRLLKCVLLVLERNHVEVEACLANHFHELTLIARICRRMANMPLKIDDLRIAFSWHISRSSSFFRSRYIKNRSHVVDIIVTLLVWTLRVGSRAIEEAFLLCILFLVRGL